VIIAYTRRGQGAPLVLIHGYPLQGSIWDPVAQLLEAEFDMIIPDLRGFGDSDAEDAGRLMSAYASDVAGVMHGMDVPKAYVVGHSMGGYVALALLREHPEMVLGLGLVASQLLPDTPDRRQARYAAAQDVLAKGVGPVAETMSTKLSSDAAVQAAMRELISRQRPAGVASALEAMAERPDSTELVAACKAPVVVVHGQKDALIPVERGQDVVRVLPAARYVELPHAGHMPMMEDPQAVAEALRSFLGPSR
jgi:pimeloyl-ACP methyl ester carboxylesterase